MKISLSPKIKSYWLDSVNRFSMQSLEKFVSYFFDDINITISLNEPTDGVIYDIQDDYDFDPKKINIMLCVENCPQFNHYKHFNKYGSYGNKNIKIYFYGFIDKIQKTESYIAIPIIYTQMNYFQKYYNIIQPSKYTSHENKKFCLVATTLNSHHKQKIYNMLTSLGKCDLISDFSNTIGPKSMYHDEELLNLFNQYLFVFVCENRVSDGYITEKIFNCYFSRTIPIYYGSNKIKHYFNKNSFINVTDDNIVNVKTEIDELLKNKLYHTYMNYPVNTNYYDENYKEQLNLFLKNIVEKV